MRLKVRNTQFDERYPIMVTLTDADREVIKNMPAEATRFASFPASGEWTEDEMSAWMDNPGELQEIFTNGI